MRDKYSPLGREALLTILRGRDKRVAELEEEVKHLTKVAAHAVASMRVASGDFDRADFEMLLAARELTTGAE